MKGAADAAPFIVSSSSVQQLVIERCPTANAALMMA
jgi:hypothetical protein